MRYTQEEIVFLQENYLKMPHAAMAHKLGRSLSSVRNQIHKLNLRLPKSIRAERSAHGQFKKGHIPMNKGRKMHEYTSPEIIERIKPTQFKQGHTPHNALSDGAISVRESKGIAYKWIRIAKGKWILYHRYIWEKHNGPIPAKHNVQFKDGNSLNCDISNLYLIDKAGNMSQNMIHNYPEDLKQSIYTLSSLKRQIKKNSNQNK